MSALRPGDRHTVDLIEKSTRPLIDNINTLNKAILEQDEVIKLLRKDLIETIDLFRKYLKGPK